MGYKHLQFDKDSVFLVTGGAGFIGSNLCEAILDMGYQVRCCLLYTSIDQPTPAPAIGNRRVVFLMNSRLGMIELLEGC